jgi:hypothetical protein
MEGRINHTTHLLPAARLYQQLDAMLAAQARDRSGRRAEYATSVITVRFNQGLS